MHYIREAARKANDATRGKDCDFDGCWGKRTTKADPKRIQFGSVRRSYIVLFPLWSVVVQLVMVSVFRPSDL